MSTLVRYGRGFGAFLRSVGKDALGWIWEDVKGVLRGAVTVFKVVGLMLYFAAAVGMVLIILWAFLTFLGMLF